MTVTSGMKLLIAVLGVDVPELPIGVPVAVGVSVSILLLFQFLAVFASYAGRETRLTITLRALPSGEWWSPVHTFPKPRLGNGYRKVVGRNSVVGETIRQP